MELKKHEHLFVLGTGDKAKYLTKIMNDDNQHFQWISHQENMSGNLYQGKKIAWMYDVKIPDKSAVISTLSSIDNFEKEYLYFSESAIPVYQFC